jgi:VWFA-related protein
MRQRKIHVVFGLLLGLLATLMLPCANAQTQEPKVEATGTSVSVKLQTPGQQDAIPVTIPITARWRESKRYDEEELMPLGELVVKEDGDEQTILSIRSIGDSPIYLAVLIQDDVVSSINSEIQTIAQFIERLPRGSRVMIGYIRSGTLQVRQKFTSEMDKAVKALRVPLGSSALAPFNPYIEIVEGLKRFDSQPTGRRAMLVISDGLDISRGREASSPSQSVDLERAVNEAQRRSVAIYSIYAPTTTSERLNALLRLNGQGSLNRLSDETGGNAFFQGTGAPVSIEPFLKQLSDSLYRQIALTYLSTHPKKGYHRIEVISNQPNIKIEHPTGYTRK